MQIAAQKITPCLWFDTQADEAARFYCSVFKVSRLGKINRYVNEGQEIHGKDAGSVMAVEFELAGQKFVALNGGADFTFSEAIFRWSGDHSYPGPTFGRGRIVAPLTCRT